MLEPYRRGDGLWAVTFELPPVFDRETGLMKRRRKTVSAKDRGTVIKKARAVYAELTAEGDIPTDTTTVATWAKRWTTKVAPKTRRPKTVASYVSTVNRWVVPVIGHMRMTKLTPATIRRVFEAMEDAGMSSTYMRNAHSVMSAMFKDAERDGALQRNPMDKVQAPLKAVAELEALTPEEAMNLIRVFGNEPDAYLWATFLLTGARRGEILGLEWDRVSDVLDLSWQLQRLPEGERPANFEYRQIEGGLFWTRPKTRTGWRIIPLVDPLRGILERWHAEAPANPWGLVFTRPSVSGDPLPIDPDYASRLWPQVRKAAGIDRNVRLHDLRHTTAGLLYSAGVSEDLITAIMGHSTAAMSRHYRGRVDPKRLEAAMRQLSARIGHS